MKEIWKDITLEGRDFSVSNLGNLRWKGKLNGPSIRVNKYGYCVFTFKRKSERATITKTIHRVVAITFIGLDEKRKYVNHIDGNKTNNRIDNLEWCTPGENQRHAYRIGLRSNKGSKHPSNKLKESDVLDIVRMLNGKKRQEDIAKIYGVSRTTVGAISNGQTWSHLTGRGK